MAVAAACFAERRLGLAGLCLFILLTGCGDDVAPGQAQGGFDFYVLAVSWSPSYCAAEGASADRRQCADGAGHGYVVHGLWPQFEAGWPEFCEPGNEEWVPDEVVAGIIDLMPSPGLVGHQWRKHGSCSGLSQEAYFDQTRSAFERIALPEPPASGETVETSSFARATLDANPGLPADGMAVTCDARYLREVRICLTKDLAFRDCPEVAERSCDLSRVRMPPRAD